MDFVKVIIPSQYCLMVMLEKWKKALNKQKVAGALLTDLSKAFHR